MTSDSSPMRNRTEVRRRCSSSIVPASLKSGTTTDTCGRPDRLRDMTKAPFGGMGEVVAYQLDALAGDDRARFHAAEQLELPRARFEQARARPLQRLVEVPGMNHQLRDARPRRTQQLAKPIGIERARVNTPDEMRRAESQRRRGADISSGPRPHRGVQPGLPARSSLVWNADDRNAEPNGEASDDREHGRIPVDVLVCVEDPVVHSEGEPEIVRVDDELPQHHRLAIRNT